jgi:hypothetical protein
MNSSGRGMHIVGVLSSDWGITVRPGRGKAVWAAFTARQRPPVI